MSDSNPLAYTQGKFRQAGVYKLQGRARNAVFRLILRNRGENDGYEADGFPTVGEVSKLVNKVKAMPFDQLMERTKWLGVAKCA